MELPGNRTVKCCMRRCPPNHQSCKIVLVRRGFFDVLIGISHGRFLFPLFLPALVLWVCGFWDDAVNHSSWHDSVIHPIGVGLSCAYVILGLMVLSARLVGWRRQSVTPGHCARCGYDLRATPDRCPECGTVPHLVPLQRP
jgi:hypothetical protein